MKVCELIALLQSMPQNALVRHVVIRDDHMDPSQVEDIADARPPNDLCDYVLVL